MIANRSRIIERAFKFRRSSGSHPVLSSVGQGAAGFLLNSQHKPLGDEVVERTVQQAANVLASDDAVVLIEPKYVKDLVNTDAEHSASIGGSHANDVCQLLT